MSRRVLLGLCMVLSMSAAVWAEGDDRMVPFVIPMDIPDTQGARPEWGFRGEPIAPDGPRVIVHGDRFHRDGKRFRVWGVNFCFGANFPAHTDAERIARRLEAFGINSVRLHHMDRFAFPRGIWDPEDPRKLSAKAMDRLDYFIDRLARRGIFTNVNLHVSRSHARVLGMPDAQRLPRYDKIVGLFTPRLIEAQKRYARDLLTHVNPYRKVRYADDAAVAFVEITNEDSFFMWGADETLRSLPEHYSAILQGLYARWLRETYGTDEALRAAWNAEASPLGDEMLRESALPSPPGKSRFWHLGLHHGAKASAETSKDGHLRIEIARTTDTNWHIQLNQGGLSVKKGRYYTLQFRARAAGRRPIACTLGMNHEPWRSLGGEIRTELNEQWKTCATGLICSADDDNARISFTLGDSDHAVEIASVSLRPGGRQGLAPAESIRNDRMALWAPRETRARAVDRMRFLAETEKRYFDAMRRCIRKDLGCQALVTGTIVFGPLGLFAQSDMDYIDAHAYWQHPRFPGRPWDPGNWRVEPKSMAAHPEQATFRRLSAERLEGKAFTVSEYNHSAPNDYQAECVPMIASYAASQDWDGVWLFAYSHRTDDVDRGSYTGFFDIDANPAKWGFVPAGAIIFGRGSLEPAPVSCTLGLPDTPGEDLAALARLHLQVGRDIGSAVARRVPTHPNPDLRLACRLRVRLDGRPDETSGLEAWRGPGDRNREPNVIYLLGGTDAGFQDIAGRDWMYFFAGPDGMGYAGPTGGSDRWPQAVAATLTPLDHKPLSQSRRVLYTACGRCENTGMGFSADRRTVGRNWGQAPVRIEAASGPLHPPGKADDAGQWRCFALGPDGRARKEVPLRTPAGEAPHFTIGPEYKTMWYLLQRRQGQD